MRRPFSASARRALALLLDGQPSPAVRLTLCTRLPVAAFGHALAPFSLDAAKQAAGPSVAKLPLRAKLLFLKLSEQYERYTPTQLSFTAGQLSRETRCQNEIREYEADATNWVAA